MKDMLTITSGSEHRCIRLQVTWCLAPHKQHITTATPIAHYNMTDNIFVSISPLAAAVRSTALRPRSTHTQSETGVTVAESGLNPIPAFLDVNHSTFQHRVNITCYDSKHLLNVLTSLRWGLEEVQTTVTGGKSATFGLRHCPLLCRHISFMSNYCVDGLTRQQMKFEFIKPLVKVLKWLTIRYVIDKNCSHWISVIRPCNWPVISQQYRVTIWQQAEYFCLI